MNYDQKHAGQTILYQILYVKNGWICLAKQRMQNKN